jgi:uncharacterized cupredoxin-like copper-binding protein
MMSIENTPMKNSNTGWIIAGVIIVIVIIVVSVVAYQQLMPSSSASPLPTETPTSSPSTLVTPSSSAQALALYAVTVGGSGLTFGFGTSQSSISSPGATLTLTVGQTYTLTLYNVGDTLHSWEISSTKAVGTPTWGAGIAVDSFLAAGSSESVNFTPTQAGNYYVCTVPGHIQLGMWGNVVVNQ